MIPRLPSLLPTYLLIISILPPFQQQCPATLYVSAKPLTSSSSSYLSSDPETITTHCLQALHDVENGSSDAKHFGEVILPSIMSSFGRTLYGDSSNTFDTTITTRTSQGINACLSKLCLLSHSLPEVYESLYEVIKEGGDKFAKSALKDDVQVEGSEEEGGRERAASVFNDLAARLGGVCIWNSVDVDTASDNNNAPRPPKSIKHLLLSHSWVLTNGTIPTIGKNYAYMLEQSDDIVGAREVLERCRDVDEDRVREGGKGKDWGLEVLLFTLCGPHYGSVDEARERYYDILRRGLELIQKLDGRTPSEESHMAHVDPLRDLGQMPINWPYLGGDTGRLMGILSEVLRKTYPTLTEDDFDGDGGDFSDEEGEEPMRICVLCEYAGNTSPGWLLQSVLLSLHKHYPTEVKLILFMNPGLDTEFARTVGGLEGVEKRELDVASVRRSRDIVRNGRCSHVLYSAIGMSPLTYFLSFTNLGGTGIQYGHGHPVVVGGVGGVEYFVSSIGWRGREGRVEFWEEGRRGGGGGGGEPSVVLFDTLTTSPDLLSTFETISDLPGTMDSFGLPSYIMESDNPGDVRKVNHYALLQYSKKLHPVIDAVIKGVLAADPNGVVVLLEGSRRHIPRFARTMSEDAIDRILFVPRMPRESILKLLSFCKAMIGSYPWGEGVTSFEAFSLGLPVVVGRGMTTVEALTAGQVRAFGDEVLEGALIAEDEDDMVRKIVRLGMDEAWGDIVKERILNKRGRLFDRGEEVAGEWLGFFRRTRR